MAVLHEVPHVAVSLVHEVEVALEVTTGGNELAGTPLAVTQAGLFAWLYGAVGAQDVAHAGGALFIALLGLGALTVGGGQDALEGVLPGLFELDAGEERGIAIRLLQLPAVFLGEGQEGGELVAQDGVTGQAGALQTL
jgi:hypothetical protein